MRPEHTDPREARRLGIRRLRLVTACLGAAAVVGTGGITLAVAEQPAAAGEVAPATGTAPPGTPPADTPPAGTPPTGTVPADSGLNAPAQPPAPADPGPVDASSGGS